MKARAPKFALLLAFYLPLALPVQSQPTPDYSAPRPVVSEIITVEQPITRGFPGLVTATNQVSLAFQTGGLLLSADGEAGDRVQKGQVIGQLDPVSLQEDTAAAAANLRAAQAQADAAATNYARMQKLQAQNVAATAQLEAVKAANDMAQASVLAAQARLDLAKDAEGFATLRAPSDGILVEIHVDPGMTIAAGQPIVTLAAMGEREVVIDVPTASLPLFAPGMEMRMRTSHGASWPAKVRLVEPVANATARSHRVRVALSDQSVRLGTLVTIDPDLEAQAFLSLPQEAVMTNDKGRAVWRITAERRLALQPVVLGEYINGRVQIREGLSEGDEVLLRGLNFAREGLQVGERDAQ